MTSVTLPGPEVLVGSPRLSCNLTLPEDLRRPALQCAGASALPGSSRLKASASCSSWVRDALTLVPGT